MIHPDPCHTEQSIRSSSKHFQAPTLNSHSSQLPSELEKRVLLMRIVGKGGCLGERLHNNLFGAKVCIRRYLRCRNNNGNDGGRLQGWGGFFGITGSPNYSRIDPGDLIFGLGLGLGGVRGKVGFCRFYWNSDFWPDIKKSA